MDVQSAVSTLSALAQESRLAIFRLLVQAGPEGLPATQIAERLGLPPSSLSFHLKELTHAGMLRQTKAGRLLIYSASFDTMHALLDFLTENCCAGNPCAPVRTPACSTGESLAATSHAESLRATANARPPVSAGRS